MDNKLYILELVNTEYDTEEIVGIFDDLLKIPDTVYHQEIRDYSHITERVGTVVNSYITTNREGSAFYYKHLFEELVPYFKENGCIVDMKSPIYDKVYELSRCGFKYFRYYHVTLNEII